MGESKNEWATKVTHRPRGARDVLILSLLASGLPLTVTDIATLAGLPRGYVNDRLLYMTAAKFVTRVDSEPDGTRRRPPREHTITDAGRERLDISIVNFMMGKN